MNELTITEYKDIRVLTTQQLAEEYGTDSDTLNKNFNNNKNRYIEGKHYILLQGNELREAKAKGKFYGLLPNANKFYLWTEKGAFLHAKSLNTDRAWEVYDRLVDSYFQKTQRPLTQLEILQQSIEVLERHETEIKKIDNRMDKLENDIPLYGSEADELSNHVKRKGVAVLGGKKSNAYKDINLRSKVYRDIYNQIKREFDIYGEDGKPKSYKALKRKYLADAHELIDAYEVPFCIAELIDYANSQINLEIA